MKTSLGKIVIIPIVIFLFCPSAFAEGPSAWLNINYLNTQTYQEGEKMQSSDSLFQNYQFSFDKRVNPVISYSLYLRANLMNDHTTGADDIETKTYMRSVEPAIDIFLHNPMYGLDIGYRRLEQWRTAHITNESRITNDFYYGRFSLTPYAFPSLYLQFERDKQYDHLSERITDVTNTRYLASSSYNIPYKSLNFNYNLTFTRNENKNPIDKTVPKITDDTFNGSYFVNFNKSFWDNNATVSANYQGNYARNQLKQFTTQTGEVSFKRAPVTGMYGLGTPIEPDVDMLSSVNTLSDEIYSVPVSTLSGTINLGMNGTEYHNVGIQLFSSERSVDTLFIYINKDVTLDTNLANPNNWRVYASNVNLTGTTWTQVSIQTVTISEYDDDDPFTDIYRYEIRFSNPQNNIFFKAINMSTATVLDVFVTEIEAFGTDFISESGKITDTSTAFTQGINLNATVRPIKGLTLSLNYFINKADQNPKSFVDSIGSLFSSMVNKLSLEEDEELRSNVTRTYGATAVWLTHRLLTTTVNFQRNEAFDNKDETDFRSDIYSLGFSSSPLPTLDTNLSLVRTYTYSFDYKQSMSDLYALTINTNLYKGVNMTADIGYTKTKDFAIEDESDSIAPTEDTQSSSTYLRGAIDATLTPKLFANVTYSLNKSSGDTSSTSHDGILMVSYRPGRFINLSGQFRYSDIGGIVSTSEGFLVDWLPIPVLRLNLNYFHSYTDADSVMSDTLNSYAIWYIKKFLDVQFNFRYSRADAEQETERYEFGVNLTCRFW